MDNDRQLRTTLISKAVDSGISPEKVLDIVTAWMGFIDGAKPSKEIKAIVTAPTESKPHKSRKPTTAIGKYRKRFENGGRQYSSDELKSIAKVFYAHSSNAGDALNVASTTIQRSAAGIKLAVKKGSLKKYGFEWTKNDRTFKDAFEKSIDIIRKKQRA